MAALVLSVLLVGLAVQSIAGPVGSEIKVVAPGSAEIRLAQPGTYTINYEYQTVRDVRQFSTPVEFPPMTLALLSRASGAQIPIRGYPGASNYEVGNTSGKAVAQFKIDRPGTYVFTTEYAQGKEGPQVALAIGEDTTVTSILGAFAMFLAITLLIGGLATALIVFILRYRAAHLPR